MIRPWAKAGASVCVCTEKPKRIKGLKSKCLALLRPLSWNPWRARPRSSLLAVTERASLLWRSYAGSCQGSSLVILQGPGFLSTIYLPLTPISPGNVLAINSTSADGEFELGDIVHWQPHFRHKWGSCPGRRHVRGIQYLSSHFPLLFTYK